MEDRRINKFRFDKSINIGNVISTAVILWTILTGMAKIVNEVRLYAAKTNIMWAHFVKEHKDITLDEQSFVGK